MYTETRIHKVYRPLNIGISINVGGVAVAQTINPYEHTVTPQRTQALPTILTPLVMAQTGSDDASWQDGNVAHLLKEVIWYANGTNINVSGTPIYEAFHSGGSPLYQIVSTGADNGSLRLWKNFAAEERYTMQMSAKFVDPRTKKTYEVMSDGIDLFATSIGDSEWDFSVVHDVNIIYNPVIDRLKLYDWLVAAGKVTPSTALRQQYTDATAYDINLPLLITHGHRKATNTDNVRFRLFAHNQDHVEVKLGNNFFLTEFDNNHLRIDQRFLPDETFVLDVCMYTVADGKETFQSQEQLTFSRYYPRIEAYPTNGSDIDLSATERPDTALVLIAGQPCDYPEAYLRLTWSARSSESDPWTYQGYGERVTIDQQKLGINPQGRDDLYIRLDYHVKSGLAPLSNEDGALITDNNRFIVDETIREN